MSLAGCFRASSASTTLTVTIPLHFSETQAREAGIVKRLLSALLLYSDSKLSACLFINTFEILFNVLYYHFCIRNFQGFGLI